MPTEPTGFEHIGSVRITSTSATERRGFRKRQDETYPGSGPAPRDLPAHNGQGHLASSAVDGSL